MPYGTGCSPYEGPKSGCSRRPEPPMFDSHAFECLFTGSLETSACQTLSAGKRGQLVPGTLCTVTLLVAETVAAPALADVVTASAAAPAQSAAGRRKRRVMR